MIATLENNLAVSYKVKHTPTICTRNCTLLAIYQWIMKTFVHISTFTQIDHSRDNTNAQEVHKWVYPCCEISSNKKEWSIHIRTWMNLKIIMPSGKKKKSQTQTTTLNDFIYVKFPEEVNSQRKESRSVLAWEWQQRPAANVPHLVVTDKF